MSDFIILLLSHSVSLVIELSGLFFQDSFEFSDCGFVNQTFLSFSFDFISQFYDFAFEGGVSLLVFGYDSEFLSKNVLKFFYGGLIGLTFSSFLINLVSEEFDLLVVSVALFIVLLDFSVLFIGLLDSFIENSLKVSDFAFIDHTLSSFIFNDVSEFLDFIIVSLSGL